MSSRIHSTITDVPFHPRGEGLAHNWQCMGCRAIRWTTAGSKGVGAHKRCALCVAARIQRAADAGRA